MKHFKPSMKDGMGKDMGVSPEAQDEWNDKAGKHASVSIKGASGQGPGTPVIKSNARNFSDSGRGSESGTIAKQYGKAGGSPFPKIGSGGPKTGVQPNAGKGAEGSIKGPGGAGKLNRGNGISAGKPLGVTGGKKIKG